MVVSQTACQRTWNASFVVPFLLSLVLSLLLVQLDTLPQPARSKNKQREPHSHDMPGAPQLGRQWRSQPACQPASRCRSVVGAASDRERESERDRERGRERKEKKGKGACIHILYIQIMNTPTQTDRQTERERERERERAAITKGHVCKENGPPSIKCEQKKKSEEEKKEESGGYVKKCAIIMRVRIASINIT